MIWQLAREQFRAQKRYIAWTAGMLMTVVTLVTYAAVMYSTEHANNRVTASINGQADSHQSWVSSVVNSPDDMANNADAAMATVAQVDAAIDSAAAGGVDIQASRDTQIPVDLPGPDDPYLWAVTGDVDWNALLVEGAPPQSGEVALSSRVADELGVGVGDRLVVEDGQLRTLTDDAGPATSGATGEGLELAVSGLTYSSVHRDFYGGYLPEAYASWGDSVALVVAADPTATETNLGWYLTTNASWNTGTPNPDVLPAQNGYVDYVDNSVPMSVDFLGFLAGAFAVGLVVMSVAIGRSQAGARVAWVGTARAMGARRRTITAATLVETLVVGLAASGIGIVVGLTAAWLHQAITRASVPDPLYPATPTVSAWTLLILIALGLALSAVVAAVPTFWASRIEPVDALKPIEAMNKPATSRGKFATVVFYAWLASLAAFASAWFFSTFFGGLEGLTTLLGAVGVLLSGVIAYRALRWVMRRIGIRLSASSRSWATTAGISMEAHPEQSAVPALIFAVILTPMSIITPLLLTQPGATAAPDDMEGLAQAIWAAALVIFIVALAIAAIIAAAIFSSNARTSRADVATRAALGQTRKSESAARFWQYWIATGVGAAFGAAAGLAIDGIWVLSAIAANSSDLSGLSPSSFIPVAFGFGAVVALTALFTAAGAAAYSSRVAKGTPVQELASV